MKRDPYKHKESYLRWKARVEYNGIPKVSKANSDLIKQYVFDMEQGINISPGTPKGPRSYIRLNTLVEKMKNFAVRFEKYFGVTDLRDVTEEQACKFFNMMRTGEILNARGEPFVSPGYFVKVFKAFWHWHQLVSRKKGEVIDDITMYLDTKVGKPQWVYLTEDEVKKLCRNARFYYRVLMMFLYDTGIRAPTELLNIKISDFSDNFTKVYIRDEISKTIGRKINLVLCPRLIEEFVNEKELKLNDYLFNRRPPAINKYLQRLAKRILGEGVSPAGKPYTSLTMYDFRHSSCCYWLPRYPKESGIMYRFGWTKSDKVFYYSEFIGMRDTISEEDAFVDNAKTEIEQRMEKSEQEKTMLKERLDVMEKQMQKMLSVVDGMVQMVGKD